MSWINDIRKFQSSFIASLLRTSLSDPFGQYSVNINTVGDGEHRHAPINLLIKFIYIIN